MRVSELLRFIAIDIYLYNHLVKLKAAFEKKDRIESSGVCHDLALRLSFLDFHMLDESRVE